MWTDKTRRGRFSKQQWGEMTNSSVGGGAESTPVEEGWKTKVTRRGREKKLVE